MTPDKTRKLTFAVFACGWLAIVAGVLAVGWATTWQALLVPSMDPAFADMRTIQAAVLSAADAFSPQLLNPADPWGRNMNYPIIWVSIARALNFQSEASFLLFVLSVEAAFLFCLFRILHSTGSGWVVALAFSWSTLLAVERCNNDLVIFLLLYLAACLPRMAGSLAVLFAVALKIYPVLAVPAFRNSTRVALFLMMTAIALLAYMWPELSVIRGGTPVVAALSYGSPSMAVAFQEKLGLAVPHVFISGGLLALAVFAGVRWRAAFCARSAGDGERTVFLFLEGACIYVGTFILSSNWDYRLIFLLFCLPYLLGLQNRPLRNVILSSVVLAANQAPLHTLLGPAGDAINIAAKSVVFVGLGALLLNFLRVFLRKPVEHGTD